MTRAICDSEDEEDLLAGEEEERPASQLRKSGTQTSNQSVSSAIAHAEAFLSAGCQVFEPHEHPKDYSSLSTGELNRQIADTTRGFFDSTLDTKSKDMAASTSPAAKKLNRRHTNAPGSAPTATPNKGPKRTKTTTYGSSTGTKTANVYDDAAFAAFRNDEPAPPTSQMATFSEHSGGANPSSGPPAFTDFRDHEPNVMFRDTGSTIANNESSEQRMIEQARQANMQANVSPEKASGSQPQQSSGLLWSQTQTPKSNESKKAKPSDTKAGSRDGKDAREDAEAAKALADDPEHQDRENDTVKVQHVEAATKPAPPPKSSPMVIIPVSETPKTTVAATASAQKSSRSRKRTSEERDADEQQEKSEPLNSDDRAVGLPKERYVPRPSRRRATAVVEEPIDYSQVPEKALKKRRKTLNDANATEEISKPEASQNAKPKQAAKVGEHEPAGSQPVQSIEPQDVDQNVSQQQQHVQFKTTRKSPERPEMSPLSPPTKAVAPKKGVNPSPVLQSKPASSPTKMLPPTMPASATRSSAKKARRSHTTIYEDMVDPGSSPRRSQRSPSLSQQQAARKSALKDATPEPAKPRPGKRRTIVQDDEDEDEDELSKDPPAEEKPAPKKRGRPPKANAGKKSTQATKVVQDSEEEDDEEEEEAPTKRGRKPKASAKGPKVSADEEVHPKKRGRKPKSTEKVLEDSEAEEPDFEDEAEEETVEEPPKKKARGRPPKAKVPENAQADEAAGATEEESTTNKPAKTALEPKDANINTSGKQSTGSTQAPPSEKAPSKQSATPTPQNAKSETKTGPNSHSPIKKSTINIHRVGLNRRQRVQPLLRMVKPAPQRKEQRVTTVTSEASLLKVEAEE